MRPISGFSKMTKEEKIQWLSMQVPVESAPLIESMNNFWHQDQSVQKKFDEFSENTLTNYYLPFGVAPNFLINEKLYAIPMVIEESSVVAAASLSAKFWQTRGGFKAVVHSMTKIGQVHFLWQGQTAKLENFFSTKKQELIDSVKSITHNMEKRGGGIEDIELVVMTDKIENYYQLKLKCKTQDAMGANFINSILEGMSDVWKKMIATSEIFEASERDLDIVMCILSNYTPDCVVEAWVECPIEDLGMVAGLVSDKFAHKFATAVNIAKVDPSRAVTHNKGIMNGVDAVVLATGNDFRAVEACAHAYASRDGQYRSLSDVSLVDGKFKFSIKIPLAMGTVGGLTTLHPLVKTSLAILENPSAEELMKITACMGLAQNFGAVKSLVTTGIQKGHMKLHLLNILTGLGASVEQVEEAKKYFTDKIVSYTAVRNFLQSKELPQ